MHRGIFSSYHDSLPFDSTKTRAKIIKTGVILYLTKSTHLSSCMMPVRYESEIAIEILPSAVQVFTMKNKEGIVHANKR